MTIILDSFPASCAGRLIGNPESISGQCRQWVDDCENAGHALMVPAIVYYECLRELELRKATGQIVRLKNYCLDPERFIPLATAHLERAAKMWAYVRSVGQTTADPHALDADVILAAQALSLGVPKSNFVIATTNPGHLSRFVPAQLWSDIRP